MGLGMRLLVTGGCGFIGSAFIRHVVLRGNGKVLNLDALTYAAQPEALAGLEKSNRYSFAKGSVCDAEAVSQLLRDFKPEAVVNFAAESHVDRSIVNPAAFALTNIQGTLNLLECCKDWLHSTGSSAFRFIQVSTDEVYGDLGWEGAPAVEGDVWRPSSPYAASKAAADHLVDAWCRTYGFPAIISHATNNYGPWQYPEKLIPLVIKCAMNHESIPVYGSGEQVRDWLYVDDHASALMYLLEEGRAGQHYNIGANQPIRNLDLIRSICVLMDEICPENRPSGGYEHLITYVEDRKGHDWRYSLNTEKIAALGWRPEADFDEALRATVQFYVDRFRDD